MAKSRQLRHIKGNSEIWNISSSNSQNKIFKTKMVWQWWCTCHSTYIPDIFKKIANFFFLITHYLLVKSPSLSASCNLVFWFLCSRSLALWTWLSVLALYLLLSVCLQVPVLFHGFTLVLDPWIPWLVRVVEQYVVGDKLGLLLGWWGGGRHYSTCMWHTSKLGNFLRIFDFPTLMLSGV